LTVSGDALQEAQGFLAHFSDVTGIVDVLAGRFQAVDFGEERLVIQFDLLHGVGQPRSDLHDLAQETLWALALQYMMPECLDQLVKTGGRVRRPSSWVTAGRPGERVFDIHARLLDTVAMLAGSLERFVPRRLVIGHIEPLNSNAVGGVESGGGFRLAQSAPADESTTWGTAQPEHRSSRIGADRRI
jgi:hypothetical protein